MRTRIWIVAIILVFATLVGIVFAADTELQDLDEMTAIVGTDILYIVDDPGGTPDSQKITATNLFDLIDTFSELNTIVTDKTLINEEDAITLDSLLTVSAGITISTGQALTVGSTQWDDGSDKINGEYIADDTIDNDSIDWGDMTDLTTDGAVSWGNLAEGELTDASIVDADIKDDTIQEPALDCTNAATDNYILSYDSGTGGFTWVQDQTAGAPTWDTIGNPTADDTIALTGYEVGWSTTLDEASHFAMTLDHQDAGSDTTTATTLFGIKTNTNSDSDLTFFSITDDTGGTPNVVYNIGANGALTTEGLLDITIADATNTRGLQITQNDTTNNHEAVHITSTAANNALQVEMNADAGNSESAGGALHIDNTGNVGIGLNVYSNIGATADGDLVNLFATNTAFDESVLRIKNDGTSYAILASQTATSGGTVEAFSFNSDNVDNTTMGIGGDQDDKGTIKITHTKPA